MGSRGSAGSGGNAGRAADADTASSFTALPAQLGLKLEPAKDETNLMVIDHVEWPTPDWVRQKSDWESRSAPFIDLALQYVTAGANRQEHNVRRFRPIGLDGD
jgi:hypothetical protein